MRNYSEEVAAEIDSEIRRIVETGYDTAKTLLSEHADQLHLVARYLIQHEKVDEATFEKLMKGEIEMIDPETAPVPEADSVPAEPEDETKPAEDSDDPYRSLLD